MYCLLSLARILSHSNNIERRVYAAKRKEWLSYVLKDKVNLVAHQKSYNRNGIKHVKFHKQVPLAAYLAASSNRESSYCSAA